MATRAEADEHFRASRFGEAIEAYRQLLSIDPQDPSLRFRLAEAYERSGKPEQSLHHFTRAAAQHTARNETAAALRAYRAADRVAPGQPEILQRICECIRATGDPGLVESLRALIHHARGKNDRRRLWALETLSTLDASAMSPYFAWLEAAAESDVSAEALPAIRILADRPVLSNAKLVEHARRIALGPTRDPDVAAQLSQILVRRGLARDALTILAPYLEKFGEHVAVLESLAKTCDALGARDRLRPIRIALIRARVRANDKAGALEDAEILAGDSAGDHEALEACAIALSTFGRAVDAVPLWREVARASGRTDPERRERAVTAILAALPDDPEALEMAVSARRLLGRHSSAETLSRRLRKARGLTPVSLPGPQAPGSEGPSGKVFVEEAIFLERPELARARRTRSSVSKAKPSLKSRAIPMPAAGGELEPARASPARADESGPTAKNEVGLTHQPRARRTRSSVPKAAPGSKRAPATEPPRRRRSTKSRATSKHSIPRAGSLVEELDDADILEEAEDIEEIVDFEELSSSQVSIPIRVEFEDLTLPGDPPAQRAPLVRDPSISLEIDFEDDDTSTQSGPAPDPSERPPSRARSGPGSSAESFDDLTEPALAAPAPLPALPTTLEGVEPITQVTRVGEEPHRVVGVRIDAELDAASTRVMPNPLIEKLVAELIAGRDEDS